MKITKQQFNLFGTECEKWIKRFELGCWRIEIYVDDKCDEDRAYLKKNCLGMASKIFLCTTWIKESNDSEKEIERQIKESAKHECIHLFLGRFGGLAHKRYVSEDELESAEEELVRKLDKLIN